MVAPAVETDKLAHLLAFAYGLTVEESDSVGLVHFPVDNLPAAAMIWV